MADNSKTFEIIYNNTGRRTDNVRFTVREDANEPHHYLISDGKAYVGGGRLLKKYCTVQVEYTMDDFLNDYPEAHSYSHHARQRAYEEVLKSK